MCGVHVVLMPCRWFLISWYRRWIDGSSNEWRDGSDLFTMVDWLKISHITTVKTFIKLWETPSRQTFGKAVLGWLLTFVKLICNLEELCCSFMLTHCVQKLHMLWHKNWTNLCTTWHFHHGIKRPLQYSVWRLVSGLWPGQRPLWLRGHQRCGRFGRGQCLMHDWSPREEHLSQ